MLEALSHEDLVDHCLALQDELASLKAGGAAPVDSAVAEPVAAEEPTFIAPAPVVDVPGGPAPTPEPAAPAATPAAADPTPAPAASSGGGKKGGVAPMTGTGDPAAQPSRTPTGEELWKVVLLGEGAVGKTSVTIQLVERKFVTDYDPTIENSYRRSLTVDDVKCTIDILDTAGQEEYAVMRDQYIRQGQGFVLVFSLTDSSTMDGMHDFYDQILSVKHQDAVPVVVLGNKADLVDQRQVDQKTADEFSKKYTVPYYETSALTGENVDESFMELVRRMRQHALAPTSEGAGGGKKGRRGCLMM